MWCGWIGSGVARVWRGSLAASFPFICLHVGASDGRKQGWGKKGDRERVGCGCLGRKEK